MKKHQDMESQTQPNSICQTVRNVHIRKTEFETRLRHSVAAICMTAR